MRTLALLALFALLALGCARPLVVKPPPQATQEQRAATVVTALKTFGRSGDWLVRRGYHGTEHAISLLTNAPFSHAAVLDLEHDQVIEADGQGGVHLSSLEEFARASHRLWLLRPVWWTPERGAEAVLKARGWVGRKYDYTGLAGLNDPHRLYCSELCVQAYRPWIPKGAHLPPVIPPGTMHDWATVLWDSGPELQP